MKAFRFYLIILLLTFTTFANGNDILKSASIFINKSNTLSFEDIKKQNFMQNNKSILSYGYSPDFTVWIRFTIKNDTQKDISKVLEYGNALTTHIEFYDENKIYKDGLFQRNRDKNSLYPTFPIDIKASDSKTFYLKASSDITTLIIKLNLYEKEQYAKKELKHQMILAAFFAAMLILAIYNFFVYFFTKDKNYLFYVLYLLGIVFHQIIYTGFGNVHLFSQSMIIFIVQNSVFVVAVPIFLFALLVRSFLRIKQYVLFDKILRYYMIFFPFGLLFFVFTDSLNQYRNIFSIILLILLISATIYATFKRNRQSYFVLLGWSLFTVASLLMYFSSVGVFDIFTMFPYFVELLLILEAIVFSLALADKIKQLEDKKNEANMQLIIKEQFEKEKLSNLVKLKTKELKNSVDEKELLLKELNHRVKNNMQTIVSLIRLQNDTIEDETTQNILSTIQHRIQSMQHLHELLYKQNNISYINAKAYFSLILEELEYSFESQKTFINYDISTDLKVEDAVYCGLILNELVTNSYKYAFQDITQKGVINISLKKSFGSYILSVEDNGIGYDKKDTSDTLGLVLVETLATKQLKGTLIKKTDDGVKVLISWK